MSNSTNYSLSVSSRYESQVSAVPGQCQDTLTAMTWVGSESAGCQGLWGQIAVAHGRVKADNSCITVSSERINGV